MTAILLALLLAPVEPPAPPKPEPTTPTLYIRGEDVTGKLYHGPQGLGFSPGYVQITASSNCRVIRWDVWIVSKRGRLTERFDPEPEPWCSLDSWIAEHLKVRATVQTWEGRRVLWTEVVFDGLPF